MALARARHVIVAALVATAAGCAHEPPPEAVGPRPVWPPPPEPARVRWAASFPSAYVPRTAGASGWRKALDVFLGIEDAPGGDRPALDRPFGIAAAGDRLLVADPDGRRVLAIDWRKNALAPIACAGHPWQMPMAVTPGRDRSLYVADAGAHLVLRVSASGECTPIGAGTLERPTGLATIDDRLYVVDPPNHVVIVFGPDGREVLRFGGRGDGVGALNFPTGIAAASDRTLLVVDPLNFRISRFGADGGHLGSFGEPGDGGGAFGRPKAVAVDADGRIYVTDAQHDVVVVFERSGAFDLAVGGSGAGPGQLSLPAGVAVADGFLFVADSYNHRVQIFELLGSEP